MIHLLVTRKSAFLLAFICVLLLSMPIRINLAGTADSFNSRIILEQDINITQQDFQDALIKWHARGILEYEITLIDSTTMVRGGKMGLRIRLDGGEPHIVEYVRLSRDQPQMIPLNSVDPDELEYLRELSVEAMFSLIGDLFNEKRTNPSDPISEYDIAFDATLGYPIHVYSRIVSRDGNLSPTECCISYEVISLTIIESTTPGMPKSGHPGH